MQSPFTLSAVSTLLLLSLACSKAPVQAEPSTPVAASAERTAPVAVAAETPSPVLEAPSGPGPSMTDIRQAIVGISSDLRQCYIAGTFKNSELEGTVTVTFTIDNTSGKVSSAIDSGSSLEDPEVVSCVLGEFADLHFDPGGGTPTEVTYSLPFRQRG